MFIYEIFKDNINENTHKSIMKEYNLRELKIHPVFSEEALKYRFWGSQHHIKISGKLQNGETFHYRINEFPGQCGALVIYRLNCLSLEITVKTAISICKIFEYNILMVSHRFQWVGWNYLESIGFKGILTGYNPHSLNKIKFGSLVIQ